MNYHTDIVHFSGHLLTRGPYFDIFIRLLLQVNTCHTLVGAALVYTRRWHTLLEGLISN